MSGVKVASMAEWPDKVEASISALKTDRRKMAATTHVSASDQFMPRSGMWLGWGFWLLMIGLGE